MNAIGIDLGGTKMEAQVFDDAWSVAVRRRLDTPKDYADPVSYTHLTLPTILLV